MTTPTIVKKPAKEQIDNTAALKASGLTIVHCNMNAFTGGADVYRAVTVAYEQINKSHLKIATAVTHKSDTFEKKVGTKVALANFAKGNTIVVPLHAGAKRDDIANQLRQMFGFVQA